MWSELSSLHDKRGWLPLLGASLLFGLLIPALHLALPVESALHVPSYMVQLLAKFACYAMVALALDLIWGFTGILSLGQGVFFARGGSAVGLYLMWSFGRERMYRIR